MCTIKAKDVKKDYSLGNTKVHALRGVDLAVKTGDFMAIVGASGSGNVWEWTQLHYDSERELGDFAFNEELRGGKNLQLPVLRGGSWFIGADYCRCANRHRGYPDYGGLNVGFRCARTVKL